MTLAFLALLGAPYIYDISSLKVKNYFATIHLSISHNQNRKKKHIANLVAFLTVRLSLG